MNDIPIIMSILFWTANGLVSVATGFFVFFLIEQVRARRFRRKNKENDEENLFCDVAYFFEKGKRDRQEDSFYISPLEQYGSHGIVVCVSDGMGGLFYGDEISKAITDSVSDMYPIDFDDRFSTSEQVKKLSNSLFEKYNRQGGATFAMVHIFRNRLNVFSVGDSDVILIRDGRATVINPKQNYISVLIQDLIKQGKTTHEAYVTKKCRALVDYMGNFNPRVLFFQSPIKLYDGDTVIVCSDGLTDAIPVGHLNRFLTYSARNTAHNLKEEIKLKNIPRQDNFTGIIMHLNRD